MPLNQPTLNLPKEIQPEPKIAISAALKDCTPLFAILTQCSFLDWVPALSL